jgi:hypothetical protein
MKFTIEDTSAIALIVFSIVFLLIVYSGSALEKNGIIVKLISNTDRCEDCKTVYNVCLDNILTSSKITDYKFLFSDEISKEQTTLPSLKSVPNITYKLDKTGLCYDVTISAKKSPFANIDNILCFGSTCFNEFVWWNSSCSPRYAINSKAMLDVLFSINDSALFYNTQIWTTNVTGGIYVYNCSNVFVVGNETDKLNYEIVNGAILTGNNPTSNYERLLNRTWHLENNGTVIPDSTINNINCVQNSTSIGVVNGVFGKALDFTASATNNKLNCSATPIITDNITVEAWAYIKSFPDYFTIVSKPQDIGPTQGWGAGWGLTGGKLTNGGGVIFWINSFSANVAKNLSAINLNSWHHFVGTYEKTNTSNQINLYIDGVIQTPDTYTSDITDQTGTPISIGGGINAGGGVSINGYIDEVRIYNRVLRQSEITNHYWNGINNLTSIYGSEYYVYPFCNYTFNVVDNDTIVHLTNVTLIGDFGNFTNVNSPFNSNNITNGTHNFTVSAIGYYEINDSLLCNVVRPTTNMTIYLFPIPVIPPMNLTNMSGEICCPDWNLATKSICSDNLTLYQEYNEYHCLNGLCENATAFRYVNCPYGCVVQIDNMGDGCIVPNYQLDFMFIAIILGIIIIFAIIWKKK